MTVLFNPDQCLPRDPAGWGRWLAGHSLEHKQFIQINQAAVPPILLPDFDVLSWNDDPSFVANWLNNHYLGLHIPLRQLANSSGIDLSAVDLSDDESWFVWLEDHAAEHAAYRQFYGIT